MITSRRMDEAIRKLYAAFHNNRLHPDCCCQCAVGNICDNRDYWKHFTDRHGSLELNYVGKVNELFGKKFHGYTPMELLRIEFEFLQGCGYSLPINVHSKLREKQLSKDNLFDGLSRVVSYLCNLDGIANVMDCSRLFNYQPEKRIERSSDSSLMAV